MKTQCSGSRHGLWMGLLLGSTASAQEGSAPAAHAKPGAHRITAYVHSGLSLFLSDFRTMGGIGGGLGVRDTVDERFIFQADARYLLGLCNAGSCARERASSGRGPGLPRRW